MSDKETMGRNEYARHQGVSPNAVTKAIQSGRIAKAVIWEGGRVAAIRWRLADKLWEENTDPVEASRTRKTDGPTAVHTSAPPPASISALQRALAIARAAGYVVAGESECAESAHHAIGSAFGAGLVAWAGRLHHQYGLDADRAIGAIEDLYLTLATAIATEFGEEVDRVRVALVGDLAHAFRPEAREQLLEQVRRTAAAYRTQG